MLSWRTTFYLRLRSHVSRVHDARCRFCAARRPGNPRARSKRRRGRKRRRLLGVMSAAGEGDAVGCEGGSAGAPLAIAFTAKGNWCQLFEPPLRTCAYGQQSRLPPGWPLDPSLTAVWVLPSSSGRAVISWSDRLAPYADLAASLGNDTASDCLYFPVATASIASPATGAEKSPVASATVASLSADLVTLDTGGDG